MMQVLYYSNVAIFVYFMVLCTCYTILLIVSFPEIIRQFEAIKYGDVNELMNSEFCVPVTIVMPVYNMASQVLDALKSILNSDYKETQIIAVNDGSEDNTLERLIETFSLVRMPLVIREKIKTAKLRGYYRSSLYPNLVVIDKEHSNVGDTLNAGLNACRTPLFATVDADTLLERESVSRITFSFVANAHCVSVGGAVYLSNDNEIKNGQFVSSPSIPKHFIPAAQVGEYYRSFLFSRGGWNFFGGALCYAGAFTLFEKEAVLASGGFDIDNYAQDAEIILKLHEYMRKNKYPYSIRFEANAFSWTEVPATLKSFWNQRDHWQRGLLCTFYEHRNLMFNPRYGIVGLLSYPFFILFEILCPIVEVCSYLLLLVSFVLGIVPIKIILLFFALAAGYITFLTMASILLGFMICGKYSRWSEIMRMLGITFIGMIIFRPYNIICSVVATMRYIFNRFMGKNL